MNRHWRHVKVKGAALKHGFTDPDIVYAGSSTADGCSQGEKNGPQCGRLHDLLIVLPATRPTLPAFGPAH